jgi:EAL domain-containing protein (putative c-di-GMP-specific phosphodiesterase class I)
MSWWIRDFNSIFKLKGVPSMCKIQGESVRSKIIPFRGASYPSVFYSKALFDLPVPVVVLDVNDNVFVEINQCALDLLGIFASRVVGKQFRDVLAPVGGQHNYNGNDVDQCPVRGRYILELEDGSVQPILVDSVTFFNHRQRQFCLAVLCIDGAVVESRDGSFGRAGECIGSKAYELFKAGFMEVEGCRSRASLAHFLVLGFERFFRELSLSPQNIKSRVVEELLLRVRRLFGSDVFINRRQSLEFWVRCDPSVVNVSDLDVAISELNAPLNVHGLVFEPNIAGGLSRRRVSDDGEFHMAIAEARYAMHHAAVSGLKYSDKRLIEKSPVSVHLSNYGNGSDTSRKELELFFCPIVSLSSGRVDAYRVLLGHSSRRGEAVRLKLLGVLDLLSRHDTKSRVFWIDASVDHLLDYAKFDRLVRLLKRYDVVKTGCIGLNLVHTEAELDVQKLRSRLRALSSVGVQLSQDEASFESRGVRPGGISQLDAVQLKFPVDSSFRVDPKYVLRLTEAVKELSGKGVQVIGVTADTDQAASFLSWIGCDCVGGSWVGEPVREEFLELDSDGIFPQVAELRRQNQLAIPAGG